MSADSNGPPSPRKSTARQKPSGVRTPRPADFPTKPRPDFPLYPHFGWKQWAKKVRGRTYYFGSVYDDPKGVAALEKWLSQKEDLYAGREPRVKTDALTVGDLCNKFLAYKEDLRDTGELSPRTFRGYYDTCAGVCENFGRNRAVGDLRPEDFGPLRKKLAATRGAVALGNEMQRVRSVFKFAFDQGLILAPIRFGQTFKSPKPDVIRRARETHRAEHGDRMFEAREIRDILAVAGLPLKTMVLLAANCGFGQSDLAALPLRAVNLDSGWLDFARVKTAVRRRIPLWPETIASIREWLPERPKAKDPADAGLLFLTVRGARWVKVCQAKPAADEGVDGKHKPGGAPKDAIGQEFNKIVDEKLGLKRPGVGFYALRHGFETVAGETADQVAVDAIMGHVPQGMAGVYRERIGDDRLRRVAEHVRQWLFADGPSAPTADDEPRDTVPEVCDPSDPRDPTHENTGKSGVAETAAGRTGSHDGVAGIAGATRENPEKTWGRVAGSHGSQNRGPAPTADSDRPTLRLFAG